MLFISTIRRNFGIKTEIKRRRSIIYYFLFFSLKNLGLFFFYKDNNKKILFFLNFHFFFTKFREPDEIKFMSVITYRKYSIMSTVIQFFH